MLADQAIGLARATIGAAQSVPGRVWDVRRLDRPGTYHLVVLGNVGAASGVVAIDSQTGEPMSSATLPGRGEHLVVDADQARSRAGATEDAAAELVWAPSAVSRSALYPFWEIRSGSSIVYVDQRGVVAPGLEPARHGG